MHLYTNSILILSVILSIYRNLGHKKKRRKVKDDHDLMRSASEPCDKQVEQLKLRIPRITRSVCEICLEMHYMISLPIAPDICVAQQRSVHS